MGPSFLICVSKEYSWRRKWQPTPVFLPGESHGWRSLVGYSPQVTKSWTWLSDFTFTFTFEEYSVIETSSLSPKRLRGKTKVTYALLHVSLLIYFSLFQHLLHHPLLRYILSLHLPIFLFNSNNLMFIKLISWAQTLCIMASFNSLNDPKISDLSPFSRWWNWGSKF